MKTKKLAILVMVVTLLTSAMLLSGCGSSVDMSGSAYCGSWTATTAEYQGLELGVSAIFGSDVVLNLNADGKCEFIAGDQDVSGKWEDTGSGVKIDGDDEMVFNDQDGKLVMEYDGVTLTFEKTE